MRFTVRALVALAAAGTLVATQTEAASAASGELYIGKKRIENPSGCYHYGRGPIKNGTNQPITIYSGYGCRGLPTVIILPQYYVFRAAGRSVSVP